MNRIARILAAATVAAAFVPAALAAHTHAPTPSTWTLDTKASDFGGGPAMKSDVLTLMTDTDKWGKFSEVLVDPDGKTWKTSWSGPENGTKKPIVGMPGGTLSINAAEDTQQMILPDGTVMDAMFSISADKKTTMIDQTVKTKDGKTFHQKLVYRRTK